MDSIVVYVIKNKLSTDLSVNVHNIVIILIVAHLLLLYVFLYGILSLFVDILEFLPVVYVQFGCQTISRRVGVRIAQKRSDGGEDSFQIQNGTPLVR